jgi:hypothetical protein
MKNRPLGIVLFVALTFHSIWTGFQYNGSYKGYLEQLSANSSLYEPERRLESNYWHSCTENERFLDDEGSSTLQVSSLCEWAERQNPLHLWMENLPSILAASQLSMDTDYALQFVTGAVLQEVTHRLPRSVKTLPTTDYTRVIDKLEKRFRYLLNPTTFAEEPPPVTITVLGGSVTMGTNCYTGIRRLHLGRCAWPARLERLVNSLVQSTLPANSTTRNSQLVKVHTLATGGTNTATGQVVLKYDLWPEVPDILINAYSTNDMHILTMKDAAAANLTLRDKVFTMSQDFVRTLYQKQQCSNKTTLLFWLDDYLGNEQREILTTQHLAQSMHVLANYYGFGYISYADAVRDAVYANTTETTFSPAGWYKQNKAGMQREIHPGQGMHMAVAWMVAYNLFSTVTTHCILESFQKKVLHEAGREGEVPAFMLQGGSRRDEAMVNEEIRSLTPVPPASRPSGLPPLLTSHLTVDVVSEQWQHAASTASDCSSKMSEGTKSCPVSWVSGMPWRADKWIMSYFQPIVQSPFEWDVIDDTKKGAKYGWMPRAGIANPKLILEFNAKDHAANNVNSVTFFFLKSYGPKWEESAATVTIERKLHNEWSPALAAPSVLSGTHDKSTSELYTETVHLLQQEAVAAAVRVTFTLTGGKTFKLMGIALCQ